MNKTFKVYPSTVTISRNNPFEVVINNCAIHTGMHEHCGKFVSHFNIYHNETVVVIEKGVNQDTIIICKNTFDYKLNYLEIKSAMTDANEYIKNMSVNQLRNIWLALENYNHHEFWWCDDKAIPMDDYAMLIDSELSWKAFEIGE